MTWHRFVPTSADDNECANAECCVIVCDDALALFSNPCPAPSCTDPGNEGAPCVFVPGEHAPVCAYCGKGGAKDMGPEPDEEPEPGYAED